MADDAAAEERRAKAAARQAKLLAKSNERLAKITGAAKGEGRVISDAAVGIAPRTAPSSPPPPRSLAPRDDDDPAEVDLAAASINARANALAQLNPQQQAQFDQMFGGPGAAPGAGAADPFAQMMAQIMGGAAPGITVDPNATAPSPFGPGGANMFANLLNAQPGAAGGGIPAQPGVAAFPPTPKTWLDRVFPLIHLVSMIALSVYAIVYVEPAKKFGQYGWMGIGSKIDWAAWARLGATKPVQGRIAGQVDQLAGVGLSVVPLLWMFVSVELVLQTSRLFLLRNRAPAPSMLNSILPLVSQFSPQLGLLISTIVRYMTLVTVLLNDLSVVVFCIGAATVYGKYKTGTFGAGGANVLDRLSQVGPEALDRLKGEL
ncbi:BZ3500_MvSof-1268-A1-R1_Chr1-1g00899 [Microbotryum saponariae]|uniref:BZ3500_MvSof-1268-A1-R1_Chr1-1g00899 protein n=1 Tax=Microbotryum saponariae TaxID=289078 RepID=A0A2X0K7N8_9BASI|nr:BZ3500_MvSof-1268-A1-R1_Chr1-1g00899 [Microbotryum saponariae]SCZ92891.1 BZ3501_MvSof-1269-A2-R1_Chr1-1g00496 [Microbotryum saponariae]